MGRKGRVKLRMVASYKEERFQRPILPAQKVALGAARRGFARTMRRELIKAIASHK